MDEKDALREMPTSPQPESVKIIVRGRGRACMIAPRTSGDETRSPGARVSAMLSRRRIFGVSKMEDVRRESGTVVVYWS